MRKWRELTAKLPKNSLFGEWLFHNLHIFHNTRQKLLSTPGNRDQVRALRFFRFHRHTSCRYSTRAYRVYLRGQSGDMREGDSSYDSRLSSGGNK
jgi:hypothetical protein